MEIVRQADGICFRRAFMMPLFWSLILMGVVPLGAQQQTAEFFGTVRDVSQGALSGVAITAVGIDGDRTFTAHTGPDGFYRLSGLEPGHYTVKFTFQQFSA